MVFCSACGRQYDADAAPWRCECGGPLSLPLGSGLTRHAVDMTELSLWRYGAALAVGTSRASWFGEGLTPLVERQWGGRDVGFKLDYLFPSGSYKDRGSALLVRVLQAQGVTSIHEDSSGNAGASLAAYAAAAGIACTVFIPAHTSAGKRVQIAAHGGRVVEVAGPREESARAAAQAALQGSTYASHNWNPFFVEGVKTLAYELWEQHGFQAPDVIYAPLGYGSVVLGLARGFSELKAAGAIAGVPAIVGCQAAACAPLYRAYRSRDVTQAMAGTGEVKPTIAEGIAASRPMRAREVLESISDTDGRIVAVEETQILDAWRDLARMGLYIEPTAAVAAAAARSGEESAMTGTRVAVILTGTGLKATDTLARLSVGLHPAGGGVDQDRANEVRSGFENRGTQVV